MAFLTTPASGNGSIGRLLSSDPLQHPLPSGTAGEVALYARNTGTEPYCYDGTLWNPLYAGSPVLRIPEATGLLYALTADDVNGDDTFNSSFSDNTLVETWVNRLGATATSPASPGGVASTFATPTLVKPCFRGRDALAFNGNFTRYELTGSASSFITPHTTGVFEIVLLMNLQSFARNVGVMGNTVSASEKGFEFDITTSNNIVFLICGGDGTVVTFKTTTAVVPYGALSVINIHGNGTTCYISIDGAAEETSSIAGAHFGVGNATRDYMFGCGNNSGGAVKIMNAQVAGLFIWSTELSAVQRKQFFAEINRVYK